jgi:hypothetical protein
VVFVSAQQMQVYKVLFPHSQLPFAFFRQVSLEGSVLSCELCLKSQALAGRQAIEKRSS